MKVSNHQQLIQVPTFLHRGGELGSHGAVRKNEGSVVGKRKKVKGTQKKFQCRSHRGGICTGPVQ